MSGSRPTLCFLAAFATNFILIAAKADVFNMPSGQTSLAFVPVSNTGNPNDPTTGKGSVGYSYNLGKFEVTIGQYTQFLNAVAATDTYGLYNPFMGTDATIRGIARSGAPGSYTYSTIGSPNKPIAYVSWGDAARFANWMTKGQPTGVQGGGTTETGSYTLNGATTDAALNSVTRDPNGRYFIPTENEWYKSAYYDPTKGGSNYWLYPMRTDAPPFSDQPPGGGAPNAAFTGNFIKDDGITNGYDDGLAVTGSSILFGSQNYLTDAGAYTSAPTYYGTFDQGGNLWEWNEALMFGLYRGSRASSWNFDDTYLRATNPISDPPTYESYYIGFRISEVPEPATLSLFGLTAAAVICRPSRRRKT